MAAAALDRDDVLLAAGDLARQATYAQSVGTAYCSIEFNADQACGISKLLWNTARRYNGLLRGGSQSLNNAYEPVTGYLTGIAIELATYCQNKTGQDPLPGRR